MRLVKSLIICLGITQLLCLKPTVETDEIGYSNYYIINTKSDSIYVALSTTNYNDIRKVIHSKDTAFMCGDSSIGGWLPPSMAINDILIREYDVFGDVYWQTAIMSIVDSLWNISPGSTWKQSFWYYTF